MASKARRSFCLANQDGLTKIANRRRFDEYLEQQWQQVMQEQETISVILCDVDYFKPYNDTYGHLAGDRCLKSVAQALQKSVLYPLDLAARYGGEEFAAILPKTGIEGAVQVARRIQFAIAQLQIPHAHSAVSNHLTLSIGIVCTTPIQGQSLVQILDQADQLLYQAKQNGRNQIFSAMAAPLP
ncbi:MAG: GGDEF domain-containing protein [Acaryochloridaceae cyanobacterium SU_2_1]|nr:GGDEF domain-containing protein [Acaryochloridaceae cyanobacterium SU_2_1]